MQNKFGYSHAWNQLSLYDHFTCYAITDAFEWELYKKNMQPFLSFARFCIHLSEDFVDAFFPKAWLFKLVNTTRKL